MGTFRKEGDYAVRRFEKGKRMIISGGKVFSGAGFDNRDVFIEGERFAQASTGECLPQDMVDASDCWVLPGLIDVHFHGAMGHDFCDADDEGISAIARYEASQGVTAIFPTTMTLPVERLIPIVTSIAAHSAGEDEAAIAGINMEGPFISPGKVGAQNPAFVRGATVAEFERWQKAAQGKIKLVDVAPEEPGNLEFIREVSDQVRVSLAHMCADYETAAAAFDAGARHMTHLFNAMPSLHHREPGPIAAAADRRDVTCEIIADGVHIAPSMVRLAFSLFPGRMILISDSLRACGLGDGTFELGGQEFTVHGNRATIENGSLAGSVSSVMACLRTAVTKMDIPLADAVRTATMTPAKALGVDDERGSIEPGKIADVVVLDNDLQVKHVILRGRLLF